MKSLLKLGEMIDHCPVWLKDAIHNTCKEAGKKTDDMELHRVGHSEKAKVNQLDPKSRKALKYVSVRTIDRDNEIVIPEGMDLKQFMKYGHCLVNHNYSLLPVGSDESIESDGYGLKALTSYADTGEGTLANIVWHLVSQGHMKASSIGFVPLEFTKPGSMDWDRVTNKLQSEWKEFDKEKASNSISRIITKGVLLEHSDVSVPCNADAEMIGVVKSIVQDKGIDEKLLQQLGWQMKDLKEVEKAEEKKNESITIYTNDQLKFALANGGRIPKDEEELKSFKEKIEKEEKEKADKKQECEDLSESLGRKLISLIRREVEVEDLVEEKEKLDAKLDKADETLLEGYNALKEKVNAALAKAKEKSVKLIKPAKYVKCIYKPLKEEEVKQMIDTAVRYAVTRRTGRIL